MHLGSWILATKHQYIFNTCTVNVYIFIGNKILFNLLIKSLLIIMAIYLLFRLPVACQTANVTLGFDIENLPC